MCSSHKPVDLIEKPKDKSRTVLRKYFKNKFQQTLKEIHTVTKHAQANMYLVFSGPQYTPMPALAPFLPFFEQQPSVYTTGRLLDEESILFEDEDEDE